MVDTPNIVGDNMWVTKYYIHMASFPSLWQDTYENQLKKGKIYLADGFKSFIPQSLVTTYGRRNIDELPLTETKDKIYTKTILSVTEYSKQALPPNNLHNNKNINEPIYWAY